MNRRVVITGSGVISPIGRTPDEVWQSLADGRSGVRRLEQLPPEAMPVKAGGEVTSFTGHIDDFGALDKVVKRSIRKGLKVMCREIQMGVAAAQLSLQDATLSEAEAIDPVRSGVVYGSDYIMTVPDEFAAGVRACLVDGEAFEFDRWAEQGMPQVTPLWLLKYLPNMPACHVAIYNDLRGPNNSITVREAAANLAVAEAVSTIQRGAADMMIAGATGSRIHPLRTVHTVLQETLVTGDADPATLSRPFDLHRQGMVVGEGAAALVLEELELARERGAKLLGEVLGYGSSAVAAPDGTPDRAQALRNAMRAALASAGISPSHVGHVHAHGLGTRDCDRDEAEAIHSVFERDVPVVAAKSYFGNLGAASGLVELVTSLLAIEHGRLFRTLNCDALDPECPIRVTTAADTPSGDSVLNVNVTPQGQASALLVRRVPD